MWWLNNSHEYDRFKSEIAEFGFFDYQIEDDKVIIEGWYPVYGISKYIRSYKIKIILPDDFPDTPPTVFEIGEEIPKTPAYHFNISDNSACLFAKPERFIVWPLGSGIKNFINGPVKEFFFSQAYKELTNEWPFGEWSHGDEGIIEFFAKQLKITELKVIKAMLEVALEPKIFRQWRCPCGSGRRTIVCHANKIELLSKNLPHIEIQQGIEVITAKMAKGKTKVKQKW